MHAVFQTSNVGPIVCLWYCMAPNPFTLSHFTPSHSHITQRAYSEATGGFTEGSTPRDRGTSLGRDDRIHGSLLIINELIMNSMWSDEVG